MPSSKPGQNKTPEQLEAERKARIEFFKNKHMSKNSGIVEGHDENPDRDDLVVEDKETGETYKQLDQSDEV